MDEQEYYSNIRRRLIRMRNDVVKGKFVSYDRVDWLHLNSKGNTEFSGHDLEWIDVDVLNRAIADIPKYF